MMRRSVQKLLVMALVLALVALGAGTSAAGVSFGLEVDAESIRSIDAAAREPASVDVDAGASAVLELRQRLSTSVSTASSAYDFRPDFAGRSPRETVSYSYDASLNPVYPSADGDRDGRTFSGPSPVLLPQEHHRSHSGRIPRTFSEMRLAT